MNKEKTHFDEQISEVLANHSLRPSPAVRDALMARLAMVPPSRRRVWYRSKWAGLSAAAILIALVSFFFVFNPFTNQVVPDVSKNASEPTSRPVDTVLNLPIGKVSTTSGEASQAVKETTQNPGKLPTVISEPVNIPRTDHEGIQQGDQPSTKGDQSVRILTRHIANSQTPSALPSSQPVEAKRTESLVNQMELLSIRLTYDQQPGAQPTVRLEKNRARLRQNDDQPAPAHFSKHQAPVTVGIHYTPEIMFNVLDDDNKFVHNAGVELHYNFHDFSIRTGATLGFATGSSSMAVDYKPYKGSYQHLDSLDFVYDMQTEQLVAVYHMSEKKIYDSIARQLTTKINKQYTYLQIPLTFGYTFYNQGRLGLSVHAGPILSVLLSTKEDDSYDPGDNLIINTSTVSPDRIKTNWQFGAGAGIGYHFSPRLRLEVEPRVKYYFNSVYEKAATTRKPWSFEFRTGLLYTF